MKDYKTATTYNNQHKLLNYAIEHGYDVDVSEGVLNDTYVIYNYDKSLSIKGVKPRTYIILHPMFANEWSNTFHILMTDNEEKVKQFLKLETA